MKVKLIYPASLCDQPHVAEATTSARLTPKQIVIEQDTPWQVIYVNGHTRGPYGGGQELRFWRRHGRRVGGALRSWRLAPGELERLNDDQQR